MEIAVVERLLVPDQKGYAGQLLWLLSKPRGSCQPLARRQEGLATSSIHSGLDFRCRGNVDGARRSLCPQALLVADRLAAG